MRSSLWDSPDVHGKPRAATTAFTTPHPHPRQPLVSDVATLPFIARYKRPYRRITARGLLRVSGDALVLEWRDDVLHTNTFQRSRGPLQTVTIPAADVDEVEARRTLLGGTRLTIRVRTLEAVAQVPFAHGARVMLRIERADRMRAREFSAAVHEQIAEAGLRRLRAADENGFDALTG
jgi:hypothetical protein